jgi:hypothetical protein
MGYVAQKGIPYYPDNSGLVPRCAAAPRLHTGPDRLGPHRVSYDGVVSINNFRRMGYEIMLGSIVLSWW